MAATETTKIPVRLVYVGKRISDKNKIVEAWVEVDEDGMPYADKQARFYAPKNMPYRRPGMSYTFDQSGDTTSIYPASARNPGHGGTPDQVAEWQAYTKEAESLAESKKIVNRLAKERTGIGELTSKLNQIYRKLPFSTRHHFLIMVMKAVEYGE